MRCSPLKYGRLKIMLTHKFISKMSNCVGKWWADGQVGRIFFNLCPPLKSLTPQGLKGVGRWADCPRTLPTCPRGINPCYKRGFYVFGVGTQTPILKYRPSGYALADTCRMYSRARSFLWVVL